MSSIVLRNPPDLTLEGGGDFAVDIDHANDSIRFGDGTNLLGPLTNYDTTKYAMPIDLAVNSIGLATAANQTNGNQLTQLTDAIGNIGEFDDVGGEKALKVSVISSISGGSGGTASTDQGAFSAGVSQFTPNGGVYDANESDVLTDGQMGMVGLTATRHMKVYDDAAQTALTAIETAVDGLEGLLTTIDADTGTISTNSGTMVTHLAAIETAVEGTLTASISGSVAVTGTFWQATQPVSLASVPLPTGAATSANQTTEITHLAAIETAVEGTLAVNVQNASLAVTGTFWQATQPVSLASVPTHAVTQSGTWNIGSITTLPSIPSGTNNIGVVVNEALRGSVVRGAATLTSTTSTSLIAAGGSGVFNDLAMLIITNTSSTAVRVDVKDAGTGGSTIFSVAIAANGGAVIPFPVPLPQASSNQAWAVQLSAAVTDVRVLGVAVQRT